MILKLKRTPGIFLVGFMGAGKSTVAKEIARRTRRRFIDTDARIETQTGVSVSGYFARFGEPAFRRRESRMLRNLKFLSASLKCSLK